jgi:hypothetical protein
MDKISAKCFLKTYRYFKTLTSLRKRLAAEKHLPDRVTASGITQGKVSKLTRNNWNNNNIQNREGQC